MRPQLAEVVFERRASHAQPVPRIKPAQRPGRAAAGVLDHLRLVEDQQVPGLLAQRGDVAPQQRVGGEHHVVLGDALEVARPRAALQREHTQRGRKARRLALPVGNQ